MPAPRKNLGKIYIIRINYGPLCATTLAKNMPLMESRVV